MRNASQKDLEEFRPNIETLPGVRRVLKKLYEDKKHDIEKEIVRGLTYEELIGILLRAKDDLEESQYDIGSDD